MLPIASLTKLMTAVVITEANLPLDEPITITDDDIDTEKFSRSRLKVGTQLRREEMLHLALMSSENRAAHALGRTYPGGLGAFVAAMNAKARELGMNDTHYVEPTGLSSQNQSSARDLATLVKTAHEYPIIRELSTSPGYQVEVGNRQVEFHNTNGLVKNPSWDISLQKTGYITEAGRCLVMQAKLAGRQIIMVFLDSAGKYSRIGDAERVRRWLDRVGRGPASAAGDRPLPSPRSEATLPRRGSGGFSGGARARRRSALRWRAAAPARPPRDDRPAPRSTAPRRACPGRRGSRPPCSARRARALRRRAPCRTGATFDELALERRQVGDAVAGMPGQPGSRRIGADALRVVLGEKELADRGEVQRRAAADGAHHLHARSLAVGSLDVDDLVALAHRQVDRLMRQLVQLAHRRQCRVAHVEPRLDQVAELEQAHAQAVAARLRAIDEAADRQVVEDAVRRRRMQPALLADHLQRHRFLVRGQQVEQGEGPLEHLDRDGAVFALPHGVILAEAQANAARAAATPLRTAPSSVAG